MTAGLTSTKVPSSGTPLLLIEECLWQARASVSIYVYCNISYFPNALALHVSYFNFLATQHAASVVLSNHVIV